MSQGAVIAVHRPEAPTPMESIKVRGGPVRARRRRRPPPIAMTYVVTYDRPLRRSINRGDDYTGLKIRNWYLKNKQAEMSLPDTVASRREIRQEDMQELPENRRNRMKQTVQFNDELDFAASVNAIPNLDYQDSAYGGSLGYDDRRPLGTDQLAQDSVYEVSDYVEVEEVHISPVTAPAAKLSPSKVSVSTKLPTSAAIAVVTAANTIPTSETNGKSRKIFINKLPVKNLKNLIIVKSTQNEVIVNGSPVTYVVAHSVQQSTSAGVNGINKLNSSNKFKLPKLISTNSTGTKVSAVVSPAPTLTVNQLAGPEVTLSAGNVIQTSSVNQFAVPEVKPSAGNVIQVSSAIPETSSLEFPVIIPQSQASAAQPSLAIYQVSYDVQKRQQDAKSRRRRLFPIKQKPGRKAGAPQTSMTFNVTHRIPKLSSGSKLSPGLFARNRRGRRLMDEHEIPEVRELVLNRESSSRRHPDISSTTKIPSSGTARRKPFIMDLDDDIHVYKGEMDIEPEHLELVPGVTSFSMPVNNQMSMATRKPQRLDDWEMSDSRPLVLDELQWNAEGDFEGRPLRIGYNMDENRQIPSIERFLEEEDSIRTSFTTSDVTNQKLGDYHVDIPNITAKYQISYPENNTELLSVSETASQYSDAKPQQELPSLPSFSQAGFTINDPNVLTPMQQPSLEIIPPSPQPNAINISSGFDIQPPRIELPERAPPTIPDYKVNSNGGIKMDVETQRVTSQALAIPAPKNLRGDLPPGFDIQSPRIQIPELLDYRDDGYNARASDSFNWSCEDSIHMSPGSVSIPSSEVTGISGGVFQMDVTPVEQSHYNYTISAPQVTPETTPQTVTYTVNHEPINITKTFSFKSRKARPQSFNVIRTRPGKPNSFTGQKGWRSSNKYRRANSDQDTPQTVTFHVTYDVKPSVLPHTSTKLPPKELQVSRRYSDIEMELDLQEPGLARLQEPMLMTPTMSLDFDAQSPTMKDYSSPHFDQYEVMPSLSRESPPARQLELKPGVSSIRQPLERSVSPAVDSTFTMDLRPTLERSMSPTVGTPLSIDVPSLSSQLTYGSADVKPQADISYEVRYDQPERVSKLDLKPAVPGLRILPVVPAKDAQYIVNYSTSPVVEQNQFSLPLAAPSLMPGEMDVDRTFEEDLIQLSGSLPSGSMPLSYSQLPDLQAPYIMPETTSRAPPQSVTYHITYELPKPSSRFSLKSPRKSKSYTATKGADVKAGREFEVLTQPTTEADRLISPVSVTYEVNYDLPSKEDSLIVGLKKPSFRTSKSKIPATPFQISSVEPKFGKPSTTLLKSKSLSESATVTYEVKHDMSDITQRKTTSLKLPSVKQSKKKVRLAGEFEEPSVAISAVPRKSKKVPVTVEYVISYEVPQVYKEWDLKLKKSQREPGLDTRVRPRVEKPESKIGFKKPIISIKSKPTAEAKKPLLKAQKEKSPPRDKKDEPTSVTYIVDNGQLVPFKQWDIKVKKPKPGKKSLVKDLKKPVAQPEFQTQTNLPAYDIRDYYDLPSTPSHSPMVERRDASPEEQKKKTETIIFIVNYERPSPSKVWSLKLKKPKGIKTKKPSGKITEEVPKINIQEEGDFMLEEDVAFKATLPSIPEINVSEEMEEGMEIHGGDVTVPDVSYVVSYDTPSSSPELARFQPSSDPAVTANIDIQQGGGFDEIVPKMPTAEDLENLALIAELNAGISTLEAAGKIKSQPEIQVSSPEISVPKELKHIEANLDHELGRIKLEAQQSLPEVKIETEITKPEINIKTDIKDPEIKLKTDISESVKVSKLAKISIPKVSLKAKDIKKPKISSDAILLHRREEGDEPHTITYQINYDKPAIYKEWDITAHKPKAGSQRGMKVSKKEINVGGEIGKPVAAQAGLSATVFPDTVTYEVNYDSPEVVTTEEKSVTLKEDLSQGSKDKSEIRRSKRGSSKEPRKRPEPQSITFLVRYDLPISAVTGEPEIAEVRSSELGTDIVKPEVEEVTQELKEEVKEKGKQEIKHEVKSESKPPERSTETRGSKIFKRKSSKERSQKKKEIPEPQSLTFIVKYDMPMDKVRELLPEVSKNVTTPECQVTLETKVEKFLPEALEIEIPPVQVTTSTNVTADDADHDIVTYVVNYQLPKITSKKEIKQQPKLETSNISAVGASTTHQLSIKEGGNKSKVKEDVKVNLELKNPDAYFEASLPSPEAAVVSPTIEKVKEITSSPEAEQITYTVTYDVVKMKRPSKKTKNVPEADRKPKSEDVQKAKISPEKIEKTIIVPKSINVEKIIKMENLQTPDITIKTPDVSLDISTTELKANADEPARNYKEHEEIKESELKASVNSLPAILGQQFDVTVVSLTEDADHIDPRQQILQQQGVMTHPTVEPEIPVATATQLPAPNVEIRVAEVAKPAVLSTKSERNFNEFTINEVKPADKDIEVAPQSRPESSRSFVSGDLSSDEESKVFIYFRGTGKVHHPKQSQSKQVPAVPKIRVTSDVPASIKSEVSSVADTITQSSTSLESSLIFDQSRDRSSSEETLVGENLGENVHTDLSVPKITVVPDVVTPAKPKVSFDSSVTTDGNDIKDITAREEKISTNISPVSCPVLVPDTNIHVQPADGSSKSTTPTQITPPSDSHMKGKDDTFLPVSDIQQQADIESADEKPVQEEEKMVEVLKILVPLIQSGTLYSSRLPPKRVTYVVNYDKNKHPDNAENLQHKAKSSNLENDLDNHDSKISCFGRQSVEKSHKDSEIITKTSAKAQYTGLPPTPQKIVTSPYILVKKPNDDVMIESQTSSVSDSTTTTSKYTVSVAIDIGTSYSGYAFRFTRDPSETIHVMKHFEAGDPGALDFKVPSTILLTPEGNFHSFGFGARNFFHDLSPEESKRWRYFERFNMALHSNPDLDVDTRVRSVNGHEESALRLTSLTLAHLRDQAIRDIRDHSSAFLSDSDVQWIISVPSVWKNPAKQFMRLAADQAGIRCINSPSQVSLCLEPEAASAFVRGEKLGELVPDSPPSLTHYLRYRRGLSPGRRSATPCGRSHVYTTANERARGQSEPRTLGRDKPDGKSGVDDSYNDVSDVLQGGMQTNLCENLYSDMTVAQLINTTGTRYLVVDCGGGTVDITVHEVQAGTGSVIELYRGTGAACGSIDVDREFEELLDEIFGVDLMRSFREKRPAGWVDLMMAFESRKRAADPSRPRPLNVSLPFSFIDFHKKFRKYTIDVAINQYSNKGVAWTRQGMLKLDHVVIEKLFQPVINNIMTAINDVIHSNMAAGAKYLFLVGGFSESSILQAAVKRTYSSKLKIIIPFDNSLAVLKGALIHGCETSTASQRKSKFTFGVGVHAPFSKSNHPKSNLVVHGGSEWCTDLIDALILTGQSVTPGSILSRRYSLLGPALEQPRGVSNNNNIVDIGIYSSESRRVQFTSDNGVKRSGKLCLKIDDKTESKCSTELDTSITSNELKTVTDSPNAGELSKSRKENEREIQIVLTFADDEVVVTAVDMCTGNCARTNIQCSI